MGDSPDSGGDPPDSPDSPESRGDSPNSPDSWDISFYFVGDCPDSGVTLLILLTFEVALLTLLTQEGQESQPQNQESDESYTQSQ